MSENNKYSQYEEYFKPELDAFDHQFKENDKLYKDVHKSLDRNLERLNAKQMYGTTSPHRDIAETGKVLNDIRGNQLTIIKEKANIKKTIIDLDIRKSNSKAQATDANTNQTLMRELLMEFNRKMPQATKPTERELSNTKGKEQLNKINPDELGLNANDYNMIEKFKKG